MEISQAEAICVLRSGVVEPAEFERGSWPYRVWARRTYVVASFRSAAAVVVIGWRVIRCSARKPARASGRGVYPFSTVSSSVTQAGA
jgi:hypothetical protein